MGLFGFASGRIHKEMRAQGLIPNVPPRMASAKLKEEIQRGSHKGRDFESFVREFFLNLDRKARQPESKPMTTNADRHILCQTIDAKLDMPSAVRIPQWFLLSKKMPNGINMSTQGGVVLEEMAEFLRELTITSATGVSDVVRVEVITMLELIGKQLKDGAAHIYIYDRLQALDAMCDIDVSLNGFAHLGGFHKAAADMRVVDSMFDKINEDGTPVILPGGKIGKREGWEAPDLSAFVGWLPETPADLQPFLGDTDDAQAWATALKKAHPEVSLPDVSLISWFGSAIESAKERQLGEFERAAGERAAADQLASSSAQDLGI